MPSRGRFRIISWKYIDFNRLTDLTYLNNLMSGGFVFYGGLIGAILGLFFTKKIFKIDVNTYLKYCTPMLPTVHFFGRIGCSLVGCCYGEPTTCEFSVTYTHSLFAPNNIALFPTQLTEATMLFLIVIFLLIYINKFKGQYSFELYILLYSLARFIVEFFRYDDYRGIFLGFSTSQYISVLLILCVIGKFLYRKFKINQIKNTKL